MPRILPPSTNQENVLYRHLSMKLPILGYEGLVISHSPRTKQNAFAFWALSTMILSFIMPVLIQVIHTVMFSVQQDL